MKHQNHKPSSILGAVTLTMTAATAPVAPWSSIAHATTPDINVASCHVIEDDPMRVFRRPDGSLYAVSDLGNVWTGLIYLEQSSFIGTDADELVFGTSGDDRISTGGGNDYVCGREGNDLLSLGEGNDHAQGNAGFDIIDLGPGDDIGRAGKDGDNIYGGPGSDVIWGDLGSDLIDGGPGIDNCEYSPEDWLNVNCEFGGPPSPTATAVPPTATRVPTATPVSPLPTAIPTSTPATPAASTATPTATPTTTAVTSLTCPAAPRLGCKESGRSKIDVRTGASANANRFTWSWTRGDTTTLDEFGDPVSSTAYAVCIYDEVAPGSFTATSMVLPWDGNCSGRPCWKLRGSARRPRGYKYFNRDADPDGITKLELVAGDRFRSSIRLQGKGFGLPFAPFGSEFFAQNSVVTVQVINAATNACWSATFPAPSRRNNPSRFLDQQR